MIFIYYLDALVMIFIDYLDASVTMIFIYYLDALIFNDIHLLLRRINEQ